MTVGLGAERMKLKSIEMRRCVSVIFSAIAAMSAFAQGDPHSHTTPWRDGHFQIDEAGVISRSDIVLGRPNTQAKEAMPLGNGSLGAAVWSGEGFTAQL